APQKARAGNALLVACRSRRNVWCGIHQHGFSVAVFTVFGEDKSPLNITAGGTLEGAVLVARDRQGLVLDQGHQDHFCAARKTTHRAYSLPSTGAHWVPG